MTIVVAIGASAGGVTALAAVLASLPEDFPAAVWSGGGAETGDRG